MPLVYDTAPTVYPIDLDELKTHLRVGTVTDYDDELTFLLGVLADKADINNLLQWEFKRQFIKATLKFTLKAFHTKIELPRPPLIAVTSVEYRAEDGTWTTVGSGNYEVNTDASPGYVVFTSDYDFPSVYDDEEFPVRITYTAGYEVGDVSTYAQVPYNVRAWAMNVIADYWRERKGTIFTSLNMVELTAAMARLAAPHHAGRRFG